MSTRFVLVRHGETDWNAEGRIQGQRDVPLNAAGRAQAAELAKRLVAFMPDGIVSSDLGRAVATARGIASATGAPLQTELRLREIDNGTWEGMTVDEITAAAPWFRDAVSSGTDFRRSAIGETAAEAGGRVVEVLRELAAARPGQTTVVVGHGMALRIGMCFVLGLGMESAGMFSGLANCSWSVLGASPKWRLASYNNGLAS